MSVTTAATNAPLRRELGLAAVGAVVVGDMLGSGIFFTPGELAASARAPWQVYLLWTLAGGITLCGALTLAELASRLPHAGAPFHIILDSFGPFWAFLMIWMQVLVAGPGSIAGLAIAFGEFATRFGAELELAVRWPAAAWGTAAIAFFAGVNLLGVRWGGRTQITLTILKIGGLLVLVGGSLWLVDRAAAAPIVEPVLQPRTAGVVEFLRVMGLGIAAVLFTYDGWIDVSYLSAEIKDPRRTLARALGFGVATVTLLYVLANYAYLRVLPLEAMRENPATIASDVARAAFGPTGGALLNGLIIVSIFGALGGLIMTLPRLYYAAAAQYTAESLGAARIFAPLAIVTTRSAVPSGSLLFASAAAILAVFFFGTFSRIVNFFVVPLQLANILMVAAIFPMRRRTPHPADAYRSPAYPLLPLVYIATIAVFLATAIVFHPYEALAGVGLTLLGWPAYVWMHKFNDDHNQ
ncbi:MAG: APC family permease [Vicinamibacterales bacterium]